MGQLADLDRVERLFEDEQPIARIESSRYLRPRGVGIGGAEYDLQPWLFRPQAFGRLDAIPARRHPHVDECHGIGKTSTLRRTHLLEPLHSLEGGIHFEAHQWSSALRRIEEKRLVSFQISGGC